MHREKLARNTHAHARTLGGPLPQHPSPPALFHALARSLVRPLVGGHRLLDFIEFSSSARRHPVQTRIRQLTPLACGGSAIKPAVREVRSTARTAPARFFGATMDPGCRAVKISLLIFLDRFRPYITRSCSIDLSFSFISTVPGERTLIINESGNGYGHSSSYASSVSR